jgi:type IV secretory pathway VirB2 component (pilin)
MFNKISFFLFSFVVAAYAEADLSDALEPIEEITAALVGKTLVVISTLSLVVIGFSYFFSDNDDIQKKKLVNYMKAVTIILGASSITAIVG